MGVNKIIKDTLLLSGISSIGIGAGMLLINRGSLKKQAENRKYEEMENNRRDINFDDLNEQFVQDEEVIDDSDISVE